MCWVCLVRAWGRSGISQIIHCVCRQRPGPEGEWHHPGPQGNAEAGHSWGKTGQAEGGQCGWDRGALRIGGGRGMTGPEFTLRPLAGGTRPCQRVHKPLVE